MSVWEEEQDNLESLPTVERRNYLDSASPREHPGRSLSLAGQHSSFYRLVSNRGQNLISNNAPSDSLDGFFSPNGQLLEPPFDRKAHSANSSPVSTLSLLSSKRRDPLPWNIEAEMSLSNGTHLQTRLGAMSKIETTQASSTQTTTSRVVTGQRTVTRTNVTYTQVGESRKISSSINGHQMSAISDEHMESFLRPPPKIDVEGPRQQSIARFKSQIPDNFMTMDQDADIKRVLEQTQEKFHASPAIQSMLDTHRDDFIRMFPALKNLRTGTNLFSMDVNEHVSSPRPGVTTTTRSIMYKSSYSTSSGTFTSGGKPTFVTRAFFEYQGPGGACKMKVEAVDPNREADQLSETEEEDDDTVSIAPSELDEDQSAIVRYDPRGKPSLQPTEKKSKLDKAFNVAKELVDTERRYVEKLKLLDQIFRVRAEEENNKLKMFSSEKLSKVFSNVQSLYTFHSTCLLPELEDRMREWQVTGKICDVIKQRAPYLKLYSEYANDFKKATKQFHECMKNKKFAAMVDSIEKLPECDNLPLDSHIICPVQRVARYPLLLQEYLKNLPVEHTDRQDCEQSLKLCIDAAQHANEIMRKLDKYKHVLEIQEQLGNFTDLVTPSRELVKQGRVTKISARTEEHQPRYLILFNDLLLMCSERRLNPRSKLKLRAILEVDGMKLMEGDNLDTENTWYIRSRNKCLEVYTATANEKADWQKVLWQVIQDYNSRMDSFRLSGQNGDGVDSKASADRESVVPTSNCALCGSVFNALKKEVVCNACGKRVCKKCSDHKISHPTKDSKPSRVCDACYADLDKAGQKGDGAALRKASAASRRKSSMAVKASDPCILSGYLSLRTPKTKTWTKRYFAVHEDFVLYSFKGEKDSSAKTSLPLPGCDAAFTDKSDAPHVGKEENVFKLLCRNSKRVYYLQAPNQDSMAKWMTALELASKAELQDQENVAPNS